MENKSAVDPGCFFCHKNFNNGISINEFNFSQLFNYLKIKLQLDHKSVFLCGECNKIGFQLYQQINQLEVTQMRINYSLEQLILKLSCDSGTGAGALQNLVKEKCISQLKGVKYPQVKLRRLARVQVVIPVPEHADLSVSPLSSPPPPSPASPSPLSPEPEESFIKMEVDDDDEPNSNPTTIRKHRPPSKHPKACRFCGQSLRNSEFCYYHEEEKHPDKILLEAKLETTTDSQFFQICKDLLARRTVAQSRPPKIARMTTTNSSSLHGCMYCQYSYSKMKSLKHHMTRSHLPTLIEKVKHLQQIVSQCTNPELDKTGLPCQYCDNVFENRSGLQNHKLTSCQTLNSEVESKTVEDPLVSPISSPHSSDPPSSQEGTIIKMEVDNDPDLNHEAPTISRPKRVSTRKLKPSDNPKACQFCSKVLNKSQTCDYHEVINHPDKLLMEGKLDNKSDSQFLEICQDVLTRHTVIKNRICCLYCKNCYTHTKCLKRHTIECHLPNTIEKVRQLQKIKLNYNKSTCRYCSKVFPIWNDLRIHKATSCKTLGQLVVLKSDMEKKPEYPKFKVHVETLPGQKLPCQFCPQTFQQSNMLRIHSNVQHYLEYLNKAKSENVSDEQFELCCQDLFQGYYTRQTGNSRRECVHCKKGFPFYRNYKSHLIDKHIDILYGKLKELQQEPPKIKYCKDERGTQVCKRVCRYCGKWILRKRFGSHLKFNCKENKNKSFFKQCKCHKKFYSMDDLNKHICPGSRKKHVKRVQCDKCGTQLNLSSLKQHQLEFCGISLKRRKSFVTQHMTDILGKMNAQIIKNNKTDDTD